MHEVPAPPLQQCDTCQKEKAKSFIPKIKRFLRKVHCDCNDGLEQLEKGLTPKLKYLSFGCQCLVCGIQFESQRNLDSHISKVHNKNLDEVQYKFVKKSLHYITHPVRYGPPLNLLSNHGQNSLVWEPFRPLKLLKISKVHEEKKAICKVGIAKKRGRNSHISAVHGGKKPLKCSICNVMFCHGYTLKKHISAVHEAC